MNIKGTNQKEDSAQYIKKLSPLTKASTQIRPFAHIKPITDTRKRPWNTRFIYNKIPDYYSMKEKNVSIPKKLRLNSVKKNIVFDVNYMNCQNKSNHLKKLPPRPFSKTMSDFFSQNNGGANSEVHSQRKFVIPMTNSALNRKDIFKNSNSYLNIDIPINDDNINKIKRLWNDLCVASSYRELFIVIYKQLSGEEKEQLFKKEFDELISIKTDIKTLHFYIEQRNKVLRELNDANNRLNKVKIEKKDQILKEISNSIEKLRECTVDVCLAMKKLKNDINNVNNLAKYNLDLIAKNSQFDKNYLIKMKGELSFLKKGLAQIYFNLDNDRSPFLLKTSENCNNKSSSTTERNIQKLIVPLKGETKELISECNYYIYQELIAYQQNAIAKKKSFKCVSPLKKRNFSEYKDLDNSASSIQNYKLNDSYLYIKINKNTYNNDFSDLNSFSSMNNTNNIFGEKKINNFQNIVRQRCSARQTKDLFCRKLFSGYMSEEVSNNLMAEDEKVKYDEEDYYYNKENSSSTRNEIIDNKEKDYNNNINIHENKKK